MSRFYVRTIRVPSPLSTSALCIARMKSSWVAPFILSSIIIGMPHDSQPAKLNDNNPLYNENVNGNLNVPAPRNPRLVVPNRRINNIDPDAQPNRVSIYNSPYDSDRPNKYRKM